MFQPAKPYHQIFGDNSHKEKMLTQKMITTELEDGGGGIIPYSIKKRIL